MSNENKTGSVTNSTQQAPNNSTSWLKKEDIFSIGNTVEGDEDGMTIIICYGETANIEGILLREILKLFGDYSIVEREDFALTDEQEDAKDFDVLYRTNLPYSEYMAVHTGKV